MVQPKIHKACVMFLFSTICITCRDLLQRVQGSSQMLNEVMFRTTLESDLAKLRQTLTGQPHRAKMALHSCR